jgi:branched-chain amino acid transport system permease protein
MSSTATAALQRVRASSLLDVIGLLLVAALLLWLLVKFFQDPSRFLDVTVIGVTVGATYGLIALGYTLVYGILQLINFAHGDVFALAGLAAFSIITWLGLDAATSVPIVIGGLVLVLVVTMPGFALANAVIERVAYKPLRNAPRLAPLITAVGVSFILQNIGLAIYGPSFHTIPDVIPRTDAIEIGGVAIQWNKLAVFAVVIPLLLLLTWFVRSTRQGKSMRAVAQDTDAAAMLGIDVNRTISVTFMLAGALAAAAGLIYLLQFNMRYDTGFELGLIAFTAAVLGGIGNLPGAVLGAMVIGLIQAYNEGLDGTPGGDWTRTIVFGILIATLVFRPEGLLGERTPEGA